MYNSVPTLPIDVKYNLVDIEGNENKHPFEKKKKNFSCCAYKCDLHESKHTSNSW